MADTKVSQLPSISAVTGDDYLLAVDSPGGGASTRKITATNFINTALGLSNTDSLPEGSTNQYSKWSYVTPFANNYITPKDSTKKLFIGSMTGFASGEDNSLSATTAVFRSGNDGGINFFANMAYGTNSFVPLGGMFVSTHAGGTPAAPTSTQNGTYLGGRVGLGWDAGAASYSANSALHLLFGVYNQASTDMVGTVMEQDWFVGGVAGTPVLKVKSTGSITGYYPTSILSQLSVDATGEGITGLKVKADTNQYTFEYLKSDGTNLLRGVWDTGNFHHYLGGSLYYNLGGVANFVIDGNGYSNLGLIITGKAELKLDASIDGSAPSMRIGGGGYATAGTPLTIEDVWWLNTWAWDGSVGYNINSQTKLRQTQQSTTNGDARLDILNHAGISVFQLNMPTGQINLLPANQTITAQQAILKASNILTIDFVNAIYPVAYDYNSTIIFNKDGYGFGSGILFWNHPKITNNSGSTRSIGPTGGYVSQPNIQANGGTVSAFNIDFFSNPTFDVINSGVLNVSNAVAFRNQGANVGAGVTVTNSYGFLSDYIATITGTVTNYAGLASTALVGTNKVHLLLGTGTIPTGTWGIYQASTETNFLSGDVNFVKEVARTIQINDTTTAATAGAALSIIAGKGSATTSGAGGALSLTGGSAQAGNSAGGAVNITSGTGAGLAAGGAINIKSGAGFIGGSIFIDVGGGFAGAVLKIGATTATPIAIGNLTPTAYLHFKAGAAAASSAPIKFTSGTNLTAPEAGVFEYDNTLYFTQSDATRRQVMLAVNATKTIAGAPYANDGYITVRIGGTDVKLMTTA